MHARFHVVHKYLLHTNEAIYERTIINLKAAQESDSQANEFLRLHPLANQSIASSWWF